MVKNLDKECWIAKLVVSTNNEDLWFNSSQRHFFESLLLPIEKAKLI